MKICCKDEEVLPNVAEHRRYAAMLWFVHVDAATGVEEVHEVDGGRARARAWHCGEEDEDEEAREEIENDPCPYL